MAALDHIIDRLADTPHRLRAAVAGWQDHDLTRRPTADVWSTAEILAHLRASDDIVSPRLLMVLTRDGVPLASLDERRWADVAGYERLDVHRSLAALAIRRSELVEALRRAPPTDWERAGMHEARGRMSLLEIARALADHEDEHCRQLEALLRRAR